MDKITRIHLAKIPYEISIDAQLELKKYFDEIRNELDAKLADEIMADIELRITEILNDRNIKRDGVITKKDVGAIKEQLGSPEQFNENETKGSPSKANPRESRKLWRNTDDEYVGGVASGLGTYFGVDPIFFRLLFIALTIASGLGIALYILFWVLVPAAKSSSDKLQMSGQPVTVASLQRYRASIQKRLGQGPNNFQLVVLAAFDIFVQALKIFLTIFSGFASLFVLAALAVTSSFTFVYPFRPLFVSYHIDYIALGLLWIIGLVLIGILATAVMRVWGQRSPQLKYSMISFLVILIVALASSGAIGTLVYNHFSDKYGNGKTTSALAVNNLSPNTPPTKLEVKSDENLELNYVITNQAIHATYQAYPGLSYPHLTLTNQNGVLSVNSKNLSETAPNCLGNICKNIYLPIKVTLYGPVLSDMSDSSGATMSIDNGNFSSPISFEASNNSTINVNDSYAVSMSLSATNGSTIQMNNTSAQQTNVIVDASSIIYAPPTHNLTATLPKSCNPNDVQILNLSGYSGTVVLNGQVQTPNNLNDNSCINNGY